MSPRNWPRPVSPRMLPSRRTPRLPAAASGMPRPTRLTPGTCGSCWPGGRLPECWVPPGHILECRALLELYHDLRSEHTAWVQRVHAVFFHQGDPQLSAGALRTGRGAAALRAAAAAHLSPAGQPQVATALDMLTCLERHLEDRRHQLLVTARHLTGARVLTARLYGVGPVTALAMTAWLGGAGRFSSSRKAATRHQREGHTQRRVTRGTRQRCGRDGTARRPDRTALRRVRRRGRRRHQWAHDDVQLRARRKCSSNSVDMDLSNPRPPSSGALSQAGAPLRHPTTLKRQGQVARLARRATRHRICFVPPGNSGTMTRMTYPV